MLNLLTLNKINGMSILYNQMYFEACLDLINIHVESKGQKLFTQSLSDEF